MKRMILGAAAAAMLMSATVCQAASEDFTFGVGLKTWYNKMELSFTDDLGNTDKDHTKYVLMAGPSLKMGYKRFFTGINYLTTTTDYERKFTTGTNPPTYTYNRSDIDFILGLKLLPQTSPVQLALVTGYKGIVSDVDYIRTNTGVKFGEAKRTKNGVPLGLSLNVSPAERLAIYTNAGYIYFDEKVKYSNFSTPFTDDKNKYHAGFAEFGVSYNIVAGLSASLGYKYQYLYNFKHPDGSDRRNEAFDGVTFAVDYNF